MRFLGYLVGALSLLFASPVFGQTDAVEKNLVKHVEYLTSDPLMGRKAGSEGEKLAAKYLYQELKRCGVEMLSGEEGQDFYIVESGNGTFCYLQISINPNKLQTHHNDKFFNFVIIVLNEK